MKSHFEHLGYFKEYYIGEKYIGQLPCELDREIVGYQSRRKETVTETLIFSKTKKIKAGTEVMTMIYPLCGKVIKQ